MKHLVGLLLLRNGVLWRSEWTWKTLAHGYKIMVKTSTRHYAIRTLGPLSSAEVVQIAIAFQLGTAFLRDHKMASNSNTGACACAIAAHRVISPGNMERSRRQPKESSTKAGTRNAMEALRAAREGGGGAAKRVAEFEVKEEGALYDVVTEQDYADIAAKRRAEGGTHIRSRSLGSPASRFIANPIGLHDPA